MQMASLRSIAHSQQVELVVSSPFTPRVLILIHPPVAGPKACKYRDISLVRQEASPIGCLVSVSQCVSLSKLVLSLQLCKALLAL